MKILRLHIENFGRLKDLDMEFQEGLHIVCRGKWMGKIHPCRIYKGHVLWASWYGEKIFKRK